MLHFISFITVKYIYIKILDSFCFTCEFFLHTRRQISLKWAYNSYVRFSIYLLVDWQVDKQNKWSQLENSPLTKIRRQDGQVTSLGITLTSESVFLVTPVLLVVKLKVVGQINRKKDSGHLHTAIFAGSGNSIQSISIMVFCTYVLHSDNQV